MKQKAWLAMLFLCLATEASPARGAEPNSRPACPQPTYPGTAWETRQPAEVGLSSPKLDALRRLVGGRGCVVRHGYLAYHWGDQTKTADLASAGKPIISTLLLVAVQEKRLRGVDDPVADFEPRLKTLNGGKDRGITWRHLACQTSGYGLTEPPGLIAAVHRSFVRQPEAFLGLGDLQQQRRGVPAADAPQPGIVCRCGSERQFPFVPAQLQGDVQYGWCGRPRNAVLLLRRILLTGRGHDQAPFKK
jgi:CubicO group peptidase (beta-lactamase class C family)